MHEVILFYVSHAGQFYPGYWFIFFTIMAPLVLIEGLIFKRLAAAKIQVPRLLGIAYTTAAVMTLATMFWYPPIDTYTDIAASVVGAINANAAAAAGWLREQGSRIGLDVLLVDLAAISGASAAV
jgi:hypothetical protein